MRAWSASANFNYTSAAAPFRYSGSATGVTFHVSQTEAFGVVGEILTGLPLTSTSTLHPMRRATSAASSSAMRGFATETGSSLSVIVVRMEVPLQVAAGLVGGDDPLVDEIL